MRALLDWFTPRRRITTLALFALVAVVALSGGRTPESGQSVRIPDLGPLLAVVLGVAFVVGMILVAFVRPQRGRRTQGEIRSLRALLVLAILVGAASVWFGDQNLDDEAELVAAEEVVIAEDEQFGQGEEGGLLGASGPDLLALGLILLVITGAVLRSRRKAVAQPVATAEGDRVSVELAPAVEVAHHHLSEEADPRQAVLLAYDTLERALADLGRERHTSETAAEHMARVLGDVPALEGPGVRLGELYELARFSRSQITEADRSEAMHSLDEARSSLALARVGES